MVAGLLASALAASSICPLPEPAAVRDRQGARAFVEVGDSEWTSGRKDTALAAYREALRLDPENARAREGFGELCSRNSAAAALARGRALMDAGDRRAAIGIFEALRRQSPDPAVALLEAICLYEEGDDERARPLLIEARRNPDLAPRASYFLGLIELRDGDGADAAGYFERAVDTREEALAERAEVLRSAAWRAGRGVVSVFAESGYDSNVNYSPDGTPASADGAGAGGVAVSLRPLGLSGPYLRASGVYRRQAQAHDRDLGAVAGLAGWRFGRGESYLFGDYGFEATMLGTAPYLYAHRLRAGARGEIGRVAFLALSGVRLGAYQTAAAVPYSGTLVTLDPEVSLRFPLGSSLALGYHAERDFADTESARSWEHGPRAGLRVALLPTLRARVEASWLSRPFDAPAAGSSQARFDRILYVGAAVEKDFAGRFTVRLSGGDRIASSNLPAYSYSRLTAALTLSYTLGFY